GGKDRAILAEGDVHRIATTAETLRPVGGRTSPTGGFFAAGIETGHAVAGVLRHVDPRLARLHVHLAAATAQAAHDLLARLELVVDFPHPVAVAHRVAARDVHRVSHRANRSDRHLTGDLG